jgi:hypothetical protein
MWLLADAQRIAPRDPERAARRATEASMISDGDVAPQSRLLLLQFRMGRIDSVDSLRAIRIDLDDLLQSGGPTGIVLSRYLRASDFVLEIVDSVAQGAGNPDLRLFLAAEATRDSLEMTRLARQFFQRIAEEHQASPYAAKALLAVAAIDSSAADSTESLLAARYPDSPYYLAARGQDAPGFTALEDSLLRFANSLRRANRPATQPRPQTPTSPGVRVPQ